MRSKFENLDFLRDCQIFVLKLFWQILVQEIPAARPTAVMATIYRRNSASHLSMTLIRFKKSQAPLTPVTVLKSVNYVNCQ